MKAAEAAGFKNLKRTPFGAAVCEQVCTMRSLSRRSGTCRFHEIIRSGGQINVSDQDIQCDCTRRASRLDKEKYAINESDEPEGILLRSQKLHDYPFPKSVLGIARAGAGTNNIPVKECTEQRHRRLQYPRS